MHTRITELEGMGLAVKVGAGNVIQEEIQVCIGKIRDAITDFQLGLQVDDHNTLNVSTLDVYSSLLLI